MHAHSQVKHGPQPAVAMHARRRFARVVALGGGMHIAGLRTCPRGYLHVQYCQLRVGCPQVGMRTAVAGLQVGGVDHEGLPRGGGGGGGGERARAQKDRGTEGSEKWRCLCMSLASGLRRLHPPTPPPCSSAACTCFPSHRSTGTPRPLPSAQHTPVKQRLWHPPSAPAAAAWLRRWPAPTCIRGPALRRAGSGAAPVIRKGSRQDVFVSWQQCSSWWGRLAASVCRRGAWQWHSARKHRRQEQGHVSMWAGGRHLRSQAGAGKLHGEDGLQVHAQKARHA